MKLRNLAIVSVLALMMALTAALPAVQAESVGAGYVYLYNDGANENTSATTDWQFYVDAPAALALDDSSGYWNFTAYGEMVNNTGTASTGTYHVNITITAGGVVEYLHASIAVSKTVVVYGNMSLAAADYSAYTSNGSAVINITLKSSAWVLKDWYSGTFSIVDTETEAMVLNLIGPVVGLVVVVFVIGFVAEMMTTAGKGFSGGTERGKSKGEGSKGHKKRK
jgi:hypothetical protein